MAQRSLVMPRRQPYIAHAAADQTHRLKNPDPLHTQAEAALRTQHTAAGTNPENIS